ncbi:MAG: M23 family metallopeptidase [Chitinophagaceae bacterium]|nr:M23 family metallopeptidase [Chitinophagaceae bacterium]
MKTALSLLLSALSLPSFAQQDIRFFSEKKERGFILYAANNEYGPVSVSLELDLTNLQFSKDPQKIFVIPARTEKFNLGDLDIVTPGERYKYSYRYRSNIGDVTLLKYDTTYAYELPYQKGQSFVVAQGYNGRLSHQGENAIDFSMPEGTEVLAAREGIVVRVVQNNAESCPEEACKKYNNFITLLHPDGTLANYVHLKYKGSKVKPGDQVNKGYLIGFSGNTGWTNGPHLHFSCALPGLEKRETLRTVFRTGDGTQLEYLAEKERVMRGY